MVAEIISVIGILLIVSMFEFGILFEVLLDGDIRFSIFNPVKNYNRWTSMNWFGVILCTLLITAACPGLAVGYWFYKLCTVGRKG